MKQKIAIFHDYFDEIGGAEIFILLYLAKGLNATIYTTNIDRKKINKLGIYGVKIMSIGKIPNIKHIKQLCAQIRFFLAKIRGYDLFIFIGRS